MIFDATILLNEGRNDAARSGAFFVAKNIYERLNSNENFNVMLYFDLSNLNLFLKSAFKYENETVNDFGGFFWRLFSKINYLMWKIHGRIYSLSLLRKPFALGILLSQFVLKKTQKLNMDLVSKCQVFFSPLNRAPNQIRVLNHMKFVTILHDAIPFWFPEDGGGQWARDLRKIVEGANEKDRFLCVSENSLNDFHKINPFISSCNAKIMHLAADDGFCEKKDDKQLEKIKNKFGIPLNKKYVLCLSSVSPRKNFKRIINTFLAFVEKNNVEDLVIVVCGACSKEFVERIRKENIQYCADIYQYVFPTGYINDFEKKIFYQNALWFVYTSQYEGFGLPPLEAMKCGCPVIVSDNSSLPEVVGDAGIKIRWDDDEQHVRTYERLYSNSQLRMEMIDKGLVWVKNFSWEKTAAVAEQTVIDFCSI